MKLLKLAAFAVILTGCSSVQTDRAYQELGRSENFKLDNSLIIGFEKVSEHKAFKDSAHQPFYDFITLPENISAAEKRLFTRVLTNQTKVIMPTQIVFQEEDGLEFAYNTHKEPINKHQLKTKYSYADSVSALESAFKKLKCKLKEKQYSHIIFMAMGWNNNQVVSINRYNRIVQNLTASAAHDKNFNPYIIGITWPSVWSDISSGISKDIAHFLSYVNKSNDADEIGLTWGNYITNNLLPEALAGLDKKPKVVLIGHSFGARILSRSVFSKNYLAENLHRDFEPDLFLGLQGAFSTRRFGKSNKENWGAEGSPYKHFAEMKTHFVLTTSSEDSANAIAIWSCHVGSGKGALWGLFTSGLDCAKDNENFRVVKWPLNHTNVDLNKSQDKVIMVDSSEIVRKKGDQDNLIEDAHNDVFDQEMSDLMWYFIRQL